MTKRTKSSTKPVIETKTTLKPNLTLQDYVEDFKVRVKIHNYEVNELVKDCKNTYQTLKPSFDRVVDYLKDSYNREFNTTKEG